jgi:hypothetical protein
MYKSILEDSNPRGHHFDYRQFYRPLYDYRPLDLCGVYPQLLERVINSERFPDHGTPYGRAAMDSECLIMCRTKKGNRNNQLLMSSTRIGQLVAGGVLEGLYAAKILIGSAQRSGLGIDEIERTMFRENAGINLGAQTPRNEHGYLLVQYHAACFPEGVFTAKLYRGTLEYWDKILDHGDPGITCLKIVNQFQELGILYLSNYLFFLAKIVRAALRGFSGTAFCLEKLDEQYRAQANERENELLDTGVLLRLVLGNLSPSRLVEPGKIVDIDFLIDQEVDLPSEWFSNGSPSNGSDTLEGGGGVE